MDENIADKIFSAAAGVWALVTMAAVALFRAWPNILERHNERRRDNVAERAGDWERLRAERDRLRARLDECEAELSEWMRRAVTAEATLQGYGEALQKASQIVAAERLADARKRDGNGGGR